MTVAWEVADHRGRPVRLLNAAPKMPWWHIEVERGHVLYDRSTFLADMRMAVTFPRLCHSDPSYLDLDGSSRWIYYACVTDPTWTGSALRVVVERRPDDSYEVVVTAFLDLAVDSVVYGAEVEVEVGVLPDREYPFLCLQRRQGTGGQRGKRRRRQR